MVREMAITTHSSGQTNNLGQRLGELLEPGDVVLLSGDLGVGKTTFSKGVAKGLGVEDEVTSPTFTLVAEYEGRIPLVHMDLYRLYEGGAVDADGVQAALQSLGWEDYLEGDGAVLIEWPSGVEREIPDALHIEIARQPLPRIDERVFHCKSTGERSFALLDEWVKKWLF
ncbi:tRNA (adenosine(37)-N6)-threonylcarbamoyltransferase complex ATPase subunit type 1 TsaE [Alicyclobacillus pomorum]|jgi:tRNA threonylcarbamoyladenosine biosynthesis protein TsaE|uniref:tRNA (adenosine(37)-N6)-threonylcarbamoyltransferase complex ATPase subunit type 1 TsaE n=1 Tax=Alicyclobacillus pomorum TaxID=204470 RepID=UPI0004152C05|nr:tRNA (adenosine(37)-N6)-threonylcarbamoyltransferase complex ATPase subunit type 1 TsaE [Alicyclobacillus pomorum]